LVVRKYENKNSLNFISETANSEPVPTNTPVAWTMIELRKKKMGSCPDVNHHY
jgi:hypothetical protein